MEMVMSEEFKWPEYTVYHVTLKLLEIFSKLEVTRITLYTVRSVFNWQKWSVFGQGNLQATESKKQEDDVWSDCTPEYVVKSTQKEERAEIFFW